MDKSNRADMRVARGEIRELVQRERLACDMQPGSELVACYNAQDSG